MTKIKDFFKHIGKKFKQNWRKILLWSVLLIFAVCGMVYSWSRKNKGEFVSGSADTITGVTFTSRPIDIDPVVSVSARSAQSGTQNSTYSFDFLMSLTSTYSYITLSKDYLTNTLSFGYDLYGSMQGYYGAGTAQTNKSAVLLYSFSTSVPFGAEWYNYLFAFGGSLSGQSGVTNPASLTSTSWIVGSSLMSYQKNGSVLNDWSVPNTRFWSVYNIVNEQLNTYNYNGVLNDGLGLAYSYSSIEFDPATIYKVEKRYEEEPDLTDIFYNGTHLSDLQFTRLTFTYYDINNNSFSFAMSIMGNRYTSPNGESVVIDTRYISEYTTDYYDGYNDGLRQGEIDKQNAVNEAYTNGKNAGYNLAMETLNNNGAPTFLSLIDAVGYGVTKPFVSLLNFDLLGVNMLDFATSILTIFIVVKIITLFV